ncbi:cytochrome P450 [Phascolomyces articulosus]|uniref:Cytochrome P450 n=1 Tax=Phascolomyces articulosus TaxID=60185 RepID=A0AAD5JRK8_9FUNG|nr:cytochrome P450 [Phascolomyces articulosus]
MKYLFSGVHFTSSRAAHTYTHNIYGAGGRGVVIAKAGKKWKDSRSLTLDILAPKVVNEFDDVIIEETRMAADTLIRNIITLTAFGERFPSIDDPMFRILVDLAERTLIYSGIMGDTGAFFPKLRWIDVISGRRRKLRAFVREFRDKPLTILIERARKSKTDCLVKTIDEMKERYELDELDVTIILSDMIVGGSDTTAVSLTWAFAILVRYPEIQKKIQQEIDAFVAKEGRMPCHQDRDQFPYTVSVQKECMRYRTTTNFGIPHVSTEAFEYRGYYIPNDSTIISSMYSMHRNPAVFPDPDKFDPEQFISNTKSMYAAANGPLENRDYFNFGWGRQNWMAEVELFNVFISIFAKCTIEPTIDAQGNPEYPNIEDVKAGGIVVTPVEYKVRFVPRALKRDILYMHANLADNPNAIKPRRNIGNQSISADTHLPVRKYIYNWLDGEWVLIVLRLCTCNFSHDFTNNFILLSGVLLFRFFLDTRDSYFILLYEIFTINSCNNPKNFIVPIFPTENNPFY